MSGRQVSLEEVVAGLSSEARLSQAAEARAGALLEHLQSVQPWYVRAMVGFGAWLASLFVIGSVAGIGIAVGGVTLLGIGLVVAAVALRKQSDNDFLVQSALAGSLAGQAMLAWGIADLTGGNEELLCAMIIAISAVLFFVFPDRIHRVLSVLFAASALTALIYLLEMNALVPVLGPAFAGALVMVQEKRSRLIAGGFGELVRPLENGLMLSAFGCLMLSTVYVLPELGLDFVVYPRPWISTVLLGALFLYVGSRTWPPLLEHAGKAAAPGVYALMVLVIAVAWAVPGLLLALIVVMLGAATGNRSFVGAGIAFLTLFITAYFYAIETTMLTKSITLIATGATILLARSVLLHLLSPAPAGARHAGDPA
ncbi:MAG: DUF4401 domain-containing protein [Woeseia sp.]